MALPSLPDPLDFDAAILRALLGANGKPVSGQRLAADLGLSRVAVWHRLKRLEQAGFAFTARPRRGYGLGREPRQVSLPLFRAAWELAGRPCPLHLLGETDSTNTEAERRLTAGEAAPFIVLATRQTRGRGRLGRTWASEPVGNLYLSIGLRPDVPVPRMQHFTLWLGVALARFLRAHTGLPILVKWPNDLWCRGRKLAGILTEARLDNDRTRDLICGIGLNVNAPASAWPAALRPTATSLAAESRRVLAWSPFLPALLTHLLSACQSFFTDPGTAAPPPDWPELDALRDCPVQAVNGRQTLHGIARGIDGAGRLILETAPGQSRLLLAGDVSLRPRDPN